MVGLTDKEIDEAIERGLVARREEPRALTACFDPDLRRIVIELTNGCAFAFPPQLVAGLATAGDEQLNQVSLLGSGYGLRWEALDVDVSVPFLLGLVVGGACHLPSMSSAQHPPPQRG